MPVRATSLNRLVLRWARERAGLSIEAAAEKIGKTAEALTSWEEGTSFPTYLQLEELAERVYKRPVALFFFPEPPTEEPVQHEFRTLPDAEIQSLSADTQYAIRQARALRQSVVELTDGVNPAGRVITRDLRATASGHLDELAARVREYLGVTLEVQQGWGSSRRAMGNWRDAIEAVGVFVFKRSFEQEEVSGFCLHDDEFPLIMVNNSTPFTRQVFTLFHELSHLLFGVSSLTKDDPSFAERFSGEAKRLEIACNRLTAEILVPSSSFPWHELIGSSDRLGAIEWLAGRYSVSREVILRKARERELVDQAEYEALTRRWAEEARNRPQGEGGNYYLTQAAYLGPAFLQLAFSQYHSGRIEIAQLADHLGMRARNVKRLEEILFPQA